MTDLAFNESEDANRYKLGLTDDVMWVRTVGSESRLYLRPAGGTSGTHIGTIETNTGAAGFPA